MTKFIQSLRSGQITIPSDFRKKLNIKSDTMLQINLSNGELRIRPVKMVDTVAGSDWVKELYDSFSSVRDEAKREQYSEKAINTSIDNAIKAVRRKYA